MSETTKAQEQTAAPKGWMNSVTQIFLPAFTISGFLLTSLKKPEYGLILNLVAQIFWFYAAWMAWRRAGQIGILVTTVFITIAVLIGVVNYWILG